MAENCIVTDYNIPYLARPTIKGNINHERSCQSLSFTREDTDMA